MTKITPLASGNPASWPHPSDQAAASIRAGPPRPPLPDLNPTVFHEGWWLDICSGGQAREVAVSRNGTVLARLPYVPSRHLGMRSFGLPPLVHFLGPAFAPLDGPPAHQFQKRHELTGDLLAKLPDCDAFWQKLHHGIDDVLAFQAAGFKTAVQFSFEAAPRPTDEAWAALRRGHRKVIRDSRDRYAVDATVGSDEFIALYAANMAEDGKSFGHSRHVLGRLMDESVRRDRGCLLVAQDRSGIPRAALHVVWDRWRLYYFIGTRQRSHPGASVLLVWHAMQMARDRHLVFDFNGVFNAGQTMFFSGFGGVVRPRYIVSRGTKRARLIYGMQALLQRRPEHIF